MCEKLAQYVRNVRVVWVRIQHGIVYGLHEYTPSHLVLP